MINGINSGKVQDWDVWKEYGLKVETSSQKAEKDEETFRKVQHGMSRAERTMEEAITGGRSVWEQNQYYYEMRFREQYSDPDTDCVIVADDTCDPYGGAIKPQNISDEKWDEILDKHQEEIRPEQEKIMNEYTQRKDPEWEAFLSHYESGFGGDCMGCGATWKPMTDKDADVGLFENFLEQRVWNDNYTLTPEERSVFDWAASAEWRRDQSKFDVETKPIANAVNDDLKKADTKIPEDMAYKLSFDKDLNFTVTGPDSKTAKMISDAINNNMQSRFKLAQSVFLHTTPDGKYMYEACQNPTNAFEHDAGMLKKYFDYKMFDDHLRTTAGFSLSDIDVKQSRFVGKDEFTQKALESSPSLVDSIRNFYNSNSGSLKEPAFPTFSSSPILFKNGEFSLDYTQDYESVMNLLY